MPPIKRPSPDPIEPYSPREVGSLLWNPLAVFQLVLSDRDRLERTISTGRHLLVLAVGMFMASIAFALPYGAVLDTERVWAIACLFIGSLAICFPALFVFSAFLGVRADLLRQLVASQVIPCVAALFSFGFFPILWFMDATMEPGSSFSSRELSSTFLALALLAGFVHAARTLDRDRTDIEAFLRFLLLGLWGVLLGFIACRMAVMLEIV